MSVFVFVVEEAFDLPCLPQDYEDEIEIGKLVEFCNKRLTESFVISVMVYEWLKHRPESTRTLV